MDNPMTQQAYEERQARLRKPPGCAVVSTPILTEGYGDSSVTPWALFFGVFFGVTVTLLALMFRDHMNGKKHQGVLMNYHTAETVDKMWKAIEEMKSRMIR
jgi:hypothetical protein